MNAVQAPEFPAPTLDEHKKGLLLQLVDGLEPAALYWMAAYSAALATQTQRGERPEPAAAEQPARRLTIVYGSQTGNAKRIAERLARELAEARLPARLLRADAYPLRELAAEHHLAIVISTQGEGEPPDDARGFVEFIASRRAPKLPSLKFAVLGLGDSSYPKFCAIGNELDARLAELGATRFAPLAQADVDVETVSTPWLGTALDAAREALKPAPASARVTPLRALPSRVAYSREQPFAAPVLANQRIVARDSEHDVRHVELSLQGSGLRYEPGDALGVWPENPPALVAEWLETLDLDGAEEVSRNGRQLPLSQWLTHELELTRLGRPFVAALATITRDDDLARVLRVESSADFAALLGSHQPIDLLRRHPAPWCPETLLDALRPLAPRLYSIASSARAVGEDEVHLTVAVVDYQAHGHRHWGAASAHLADADEESRVRVFIEPNERFRLPADRSRDVIMIGPGTGIAPFRAFVQERRETAARGRNWLFFGNRHFSRDFLYQTEWQQALKDGALDRLSLAFSRDQSDKVYVQQRLREQGRELHAWLKDGAHLYVCGDSARMAKDVHAALVETIATHGRHSTEEAKAFLADLLQQGRYARDVY